MAINWKVFLAFLLCIVVNYPEYSELVNDAKSRSEKINIDGSLKDRINALEFQNNLRAEKMHTFIRSDAFHSKVTRHTNNIFRDLEIKKGDEQEHSVKSLSGKKLILFVSSSVPLTTLRNYAHDLVKIDGVMILQGTIGEINKLKPTIDFFRNVMVVDQGCTQRGCDVLPLKAAVDPKRFRRYGISQVPAAVIEGNPSFEPNCNDAFFYDQQTAVVYGDASIPALLRALDPNQKDSDIQHFLAILEGQDHDERTTP